MRLPQELLDLIIDTFAPVSAANVEALRACALVSRALSKRCQMHLFSAIVCTNADDLPVRRFAWLLKQSPHIGALYVRDFRLALIDTASAAVLRILPLLTNLTRLEFGSGTVRNWQWDSQPAAIKAALLKTLSLPSLRYLMITDLGFENTSELGYLLGHATSLKELCMERVDVRDGGKPHRHVPALAPHKARIMLESLKMTSIEFNLLHSLRTIDITHVQFLDLFRTYMIPFLKANAKTIQHVRCAFPNQQEILDPYILEGNTSLRSIDIVEFASRMPYTLELFGNLSHLQALKTISLHFRTKLATPTDANWPEIDQILAQAGNLDDIHIYATTTKRGNSPPTLETMRRWLPSVAGKLSVHAWK